MIDPIALLNLTARDSSVRARLTSLYGLTRFWICRTFRTNLPPMFWKALAFSFVFAVSALAQNAKHPFTFEDMMKLKRVDEPVPSPDGKRLIWTSKATDPTQIWMCDFNSDSGALAGKPH